MRVDEPLPDTAFTFAPPKGAKVVRSDAGFRRLPLARIGSSAGHVTLLPTWLPAGYVQRWTAAAARSTTANGVTEGRDVVALQYVRGFDALTVTTRTVADPQTAATIDPVEPDTSWADIVSRDVRLTAGAFAGVTARVVVASYIDHPPPLRGQGRRLADGGRGRDGQGADRHRRVAAALPTRLRLEDVMRIREHRCRSGAVVGLGDRRAGVADGDRDGMWRLGDHRDERRIDTAGVPVRRRHPRAPRGQRLGRRHPEGGRRFTSRLHAPTVAKLGPLYAATWSSTTSRYGMHSKGKAALLEAFRGNLREYTGARWVAGYAGRGWAVIEERWDFTKTYGASIAVRRVLETRGGKVVHEGDYYQTFENLPNGKPLEPKPLTSAPGPADTPAAAEGVALEVRDGAAGQGRGRGGRLERAHDRLHGHRLQHRGQQPRPGAGALCQDLQGAARPGLHAPALCLRPRLGGRHLDRRSSLGAGGDGVTVLEIRDGKIARETLYYNSTNVPF